MAKKRANGEGNIRKRKDGRWEGRYTAGYDPETGKRITKNVLAKTQAEVKEKLARAIEESKKLDIVRSDEYTVAEWLRLWYELYAKPNIRPTTADSYHRSIESHVIPRIGEIKLKKLASRDIQKMYKDLQENGRLRKSKKQQSGLSNATVRGIHMMLHNALDRAVKERLILRNPTEDCIIPKIQKQEMKILHPEDMKAYLEAAEKRTISVSKQAVGDRHRNVTISRPKTENSVRKISIPESAVELLRQEHEKHPDNPWVFPSPKTGEMYHPDSIAKLHEKILKDTGLEHIRFHDLRHTFATMALQNGVDVKTVSSMLGHYDAGFTLRTYTHATRQMQEQAVEKMGSFMEQVM